MIPVHTPDNLRLQVETAPPKADVNLYPNPRPNSTNGWTVAPGTATKSLVTHSGRQWARALFTVAGGPANHGINWGNTPITPGKVYSAAALFRLSMATRVALYVQFLDAAGFVVGNHAVSADVPAGVPTRIETVNCFAPINAVNVRLLTYGFAGGPAFTVNSTLDVAEIMLNEGSTAHAFFDGSSATTATHAHLWTGAAHASSSERHPLVVRNLFRDPMATRGAWPFLPSFEDSRLSITTDPVTGRYSFTRTAGVTESGATRTGISVFMPDIPVVPRTWVRVRVKRHSSSHTLTNTIAWRNAQGAIIGGTGTINFTLVAGDLAYGPTVQVPDGAVSASPQIGLSGAAANGAASFVLSEIVVATSPIAPPLGSLAVIDPVPWSANLLGPTHSITTDRGGLEVGVLNAVVLDPNLDPAVSTQFEPGREVRLQALVEGAWENLFTGKLRDVEVDYQHRGPRGIATRLALEAVDDVAKLANEGQRDGFVQPINVRAHMSRVVPYLVNGSRDLPTFAAYGVGNSVAFDDEGTALEWLKIARDSNRAYAWVDRNGVAVFAERASLPTTIDAAFSDVNSADPSTALYGAITAGSSTKAVINAITVRWLLKVDSTTMEEMILGPVRNETSINRYGPRAQTVTASGPDSEGASALAAAILGAHADVARGVSALTMPVRDARSMRQAARLDLYSLVTARLGTTVDVACRITRVQHTIQPDRWVAQYECAAEGHSALST